MSHGRVSSVYECFYEQDNDFNCRVELETAGKKITKLNEGEITSNLKQYLEK